MTEWLARVSVPSVSSVLMLGQSIQSIRAIVASAAADDPLGCQLLVLVIGPLNIAQDRLQRNNTAPLRV